VKSIRLSLPDMIRTRNSLNQDAGFGGILLIWLAVRRAGR
jgi:hypothetical protein